MSLPTGSTGPITIEDVRSALADIDPHRTNAGAIRALIGRGSYATIQKHLDAIRAERTTASEASAGVAPAMPADLVTSLSSLWAAAYAAAQVQVLSRLDNLTVQRDSAVALAAAQTADIEALALEVDGLTDLFTNANGNAAAAATLAASQLAQVQAQAASATQELQQLKSTTEQARALAERDEQITSQALQKTIDRLTDQVSELKSLLHKPNPSPSAN